MSRIGFWKWLAKGIKELFSKEALKIYSFIGSVVLFSIVISLAIVIDPIFFIGVPLTILLMAYILYRISEG